MINKELNNLEPFLLPTEYCDSDNSDIINTARKIIGKRRSEKDKAIALYYWVRDNLPYTFGYWGKKASQVLKEKQGMCTNKAVLLVALSRASGIPAGFGYIKVKGQDYFGPAGLPVLRKNINIVSIHYYVYVFLRGRWLKLDPAVDAGLSASTSYFNFTTRVEDWDGESDAKYHINPDHIISEANLMANIDGLLRKKPRNAKGVFITLINLYLEFLRDNRRVIKDSRQADKFFKIWLIKKHLIYYFVYVSFLFFFEIETIKSEIT